LIYQVELIPRIVLKGSKGEFGDEVQHTLSPQQDFTRCSFFHDPQQI
jgi:hypothetical protein